MNKLIFPTWYEFKKDIQKEFGCPILNQEWLRVKPETPLPWNNACKQSTLLKLNKSKLHSKA
jgi:hypothetical protein